MPTAPARIEICPFPGGKRIAVTTSFDDGVVEDRRVVEAFNQWGLKGTFNLNSARLRRDGKRPAIEQGGNIDASEVAGLYAGHEVAIHTATHPHLPLLDASQIAAEVLDDRKALEDLVGYPVRGMAYPYGSFNAKVIDLLRALGIAYCRTTARSMPCFPPAEPLAWGTTMHMFDASPEPLPQRWESFHGNPRNSGLFFVWGHAYEFARPRDRWDELDRIFRPLSGKADVWYATNIQLFDYEAARRNMVIAANRRWACNPSALTVTLNVDGTLVDVPAGQTVEIRSRIANLKSEISDWQSQINPASVTVERPLPSPGRIPRRCGSAPPARLPAP